MLNLFEEKQSTRPSITETELSDNDVLLEIAALKNELKDQLTILGHHYQQDDVISFADFTGDSLKLAQIAGDLKKEYIIFCGVHFMAETTDILTLDNQKVILPDLNAGCSMADMADKKDIDRAWSYISQSTNKKVVPITYINCAASLKAFVGENGGSICTSSNAKKVITWALSQGEKLLFFPDQHLGRNTCFDLGISLDEMVVYDPRKQNGGLSSKEIDQAKVILWYGFCSVHQGFNTDQIQSLRKTDPGRNIIVHPECSFEVVQASDQAGSTAFIIEQIMKAKTGEKFAIGTEINLVNRLQAQRPDLDVISLSPYQCLCTTMYRIRPRWMLESLRQIKNGTPINIIKVDNETRAGSLKALNTMLEI